MLKLAVPVAVLVFGIGGFFLYQNFQTKPAKQPTSESTPASQVLKTPVPTTSQATTDPCEVLTKGSADVPSLYKEGITWQQPKITEYEVPLKTEERKMQGCLIQSNEISTKKKINIRGYYYDRLLGVGWNNIVSADGPTGGVESYQKGNKYFVVSINYRVDIENPQFFTSEVFYRE